MPPKATFSCVSMLVVLGSCARDNAAASAVDASSGDADQPFALELKCELDTLNELALPGLKLSAAQSNSAMQENANRAEHQPPHCLVNGTLDDRVGVDNKPYAIGFELRLPQAWNGRFFFQGGGGTDGSIRPALGVLPGVSDNALSRGYAVVSTDAGHESEATPQFVGGALFGLDPQARVDYGYNAVGRVTTTAKQLVERMYGRSIARSYFVGCSNGGRQGMLAAARFADEYDGIIAGDPGFHLPKAAIQHAWDYQQLLSVDADNPSQAFTAEEMAFIGARINAACDALDGATDEMVNDIQACSDAFDLDAEIPECENKRTGSCLTSQQKLALHKLVSGPVNSEGTALYSDWPWDPGIASNDFSGWRGWKLGTPMLGGSSISSTLGASALAYVFTTPPTDLRPSADSDAPAALNNFLASFDFDVDAPKIEATTEQFTESAQSFMTPPDDTQLTKFAKHGKLIVYHGNADPVFSANDTLRWYEALDARASNARSFARLFLVPGMGHCAGGPATDQFDVMSALVSWVEHARAPDVLLAHVDPNNPGLPSGWSKSRTRPVCAYPLKAKLKADATDLESSDSFACE